MSGYSRSYIVIGKFFSMVIYITCVYVILTSLYVIFSMTQVDISNIYINFSKVSISGLILHLLNINFYIWLYLISIISFSIMLSFIFKRIDLTLVVFIIILSMISLLGYDISRYTFFIGMDSYNYIGLAAQSPEEIINILSSISNIFLNLFVSCMFLKKYEI